MEDKKDPPKENLYDRIKTSTKTKYISVGVALLLILVVAILLYCLVSKRNLSPCPTRKDIRRRYTQIRSTVRNIGGPG